MMINNIVATMLRRNIVITPRTLSRIDDKFISIATPMEMSYIEFCKMWWGQECDYVKAYKYASENCILSNVQVYPTDPNYELQNRVVHAVFATGDVDRSNIEHTGTNQFMVDSLLHGIVKYLSDDEMARSLTIEDYIDRFNQMCIMNKWIEKTLIEYDFGDDVEYIYSDKFTEKVESNKGIQYLYETNDSFNYLMNLHKLTQRVSA